MLTVVGIDEAGYGPMLGPLVVASAAFEAPEDADLWRRLEGAVARTRRGAAGRLLVADSKVVHGGGRLGDLERSVLAFLGAVGNAPRTFRELLEHLCGDARDLCGARWWADTTLPVAADGDGVRQAASRLREAFRRVPFLGFAARVVPVPTFNRLLGTLRNKSILLFQQNVALIERELALRSDDVWFVIDKHGGRHYYQRLLASNFFGRRIDVLGESPARSEYRIAFDGRAARFVFAEKADASNLPVALASMLAKYVRELFMLSFNAYWCGRVEGLAPTAGYHGDSARFLRAIRPLLDEDEVRAVVRER